MFVVHKIIFDRQFEDDITHEVSLFEQLLIG